MLRAPLQPAAPTPKAPLPSLVPRSPPTSQHLPSQHQARGQRLTGIEAPKNMIYTKTNPTASCTPGGRTDCLDWHVPTAQPIALPGRQPGSAAPPDLTVGSQCLWGAPGRGGAGALLREWRHGTGAGGGLVPRRSSWARHVPAFTPRIPAGCLANSGTSTFALAAAQQHGWERSFQGWGEASAGAAAERARTWGASWPSSRTPQLPWLPNPPASPCPRGSSKALRAESGQGPHSGEQEWAG